MKTQKEILNAYNRNFLIWMLVYAIALVSVAQITKHNPNLPTALKYILASMPSLPIGMTILVFLNFIEKCDEFLKAILARHFIISTGILLFITTFWGLLENYAAAPHMDLHSTYPMFWLIYGISNWIGKLFGKGVCI